MDVAILSRHGRHYGSREPCYDSHMTTKQGALNLWHGQGAEARHARTRKASIKFMIKHHLKNVDKALETLERFGITVLIPCDLNEIVERTAAEEVDERARKAIEREAKS